MITLTNSIFKAMLKCPAKAMATYGGRILGDDSFVPEVVDAGSRDMACGSLVDAIVTCGFRPDADDRSITVDDFYTYLKSGYDSGKRNAEWLVNKSWGWNAYAKTAINSAYRLLEDENVKQLLEGAECQVRIEFPLDADVVWSGDIDILKIDDDHTLKIVDLKAPARMQDGWIKSKGRNAMVSWHDSWQYWFQLGGYRYVFQTARTESLIDGIPFAATKYASAFTIDTGLLYTTREDVPAIGYVPINDYASVWHRIVTAKRKDIGMSNLEAIKKIVSGEIETPRCNKPDCDYCKRGASVEFVPSRSNDDEVPVLDDMFDWWTRDGDVNYEEDE